jgi:hypothetical protein
LTRMARPVRTASFRLALRPQHRQRRPPSRRAGSGPCGAAMTSAAVAATGQQERVTGESQPGPACAAARDGCGDALASDLREPGGSGALRNPHEPGASMNRVHGGCYNAARHSESGAPRPWLRCRSKRAPRRARVEATSAAAAAFAWFAIASAPIALALSLDRRCVHPTGRNTTTDYIWDGRPPSQQLQNRLSR